VSEPSIHFLPETLALPLRDPFRIAREEPESEVVTVIVSAFGSDSMEGGVGEAFPVAYYGETAETVEAVLPLLEGAVARAGELRDGRVAEARTWLEGVAGHMDVVLGHNGGAKCGVDIALHDLVARRLGVTVQELLGVTAEQRPTDFSIGIDTPEAVAERASRASRFPALKIKVGGPSDVETLEAVRAVYAGPLRVDANTGWDPEQGARLIPELQRLGVELIEQPFPAHALPQLRWLQERSSLPIVADESAVTARDLESLVGVVRAVNVKLAKCGGVGPALRVIERARALGFAVMLGCMEETSVGIAAGAALSGLADWVDLDGNLLLAEDPFVGLELGEDCRWILPQAPGLGLKRRGE
jgi:L-alanine-DL-glutamate epimerase-like enolase superfamily enzyme